MFSRYYVFDSYFRLNRFDVLQITINIMIYSKLDSRGN
jgi:hypothetical protein